MTFIPKLKSLITIFHSSQYAKVTITLQFFTTQVAFIIQIKMRGYEENTFPRRVLTLVDDDSRRFLSVVLHEKHFPRNVISLQENDIIHLGFCKTMRSPTEEGSTHNYLMSITGSTLRVSPKLLNSLILILGKLRISI